jgi:hypothetical protein
MIERVGRLVRIRTLRRRELVPFDVAAQEAQAGG